MLDIGNHFWARFGSVRPQRQVVTHRREALQTVAASDCVFDSFSMLLRLEI